MTPSVQLADNNNNKYIIVITDNFSRYVELFPTKDATAASALTPILQFCARFGAPSSIRSDNGTQFTASICEQLIQALGVTHIHSIPHRSESNGLTERRHKEINRHIRNYLLESRLKGKPTPDWSTVLVFIQRIMNSTICISTGLTPLQIISPLSVRSIHLLPPPEAQGNDDSIKEDDLPLVLQELYDIQARVIRAANMVQRRTLIERGVPLDRIPDLQTVDPDAQQQQTPVDFASTNFKVGSYVLVKPTDTTRDKFAPRWLGPFKIITSGDTMIEVLTINGNVLKVHVSRCRPFILSQTLSPETISQDGGEWWFVEQIKKHRRVKGKLEFHVKWQNSEDITWEPLSHLKNCVILDEYLKAHPKLKI